MQDFLDACENTGEVYITKGVKESAKADFKLRTSEAILSFISNEGLENIDFENSRPWDNNPNPEIEIIIDAYHFTSGFLYGYIAFLFNPPTGKWILKSLKVDPDNYPRNMPLKNHKKLSELKKLIEEKRKEK